MSEQNSERIDDLRLVPTRPPGRISRKARVFAPQIRELQAQGYTLDAIREALAAAGVVVSRSTVHREATRNLRTGALIGPTRTGTPLRPSGDDEHVGGIPSLHAQVVNGEWSPGQTAKGKDAAAAFMDGRTTNPLIRAQQRAKENP